MEIARKLEVSDTLIGKRGNKPDMAALTVAIPHPQGLKYLRGIISLDREQALKLADHLYKLFGEKR